MLYRRFGRTGLSLPVFSLGCMRSMHSWQDTPLCEIPADSQQNLEAVLRRALELGITHVETARAYGSSERQLGAVLSRLPRERLLLQTKVMPNDDPAIFRDRVLDSLHRLGQEQVELLTIHGLNDFHALWRICRPGGCLAEARRLQQEGRAGWIGFSGHGNLAVLLAAIRHQENGGFDYMNLHWYYVLQALTPAIEEAHARDMGVFVISPSDKGGRLHDPPALLRRLSQPLSPMQFNDLFCLQQPGISTVSIGAARPEDLDEHLAALASLAQPETVTTIDRAWRQAMFEATGHERPDADFNLLPDWQETPGYVNLPFLLWLSRLARGWQLHDFVRWRAGKLGRDLPWVPGNPMRPELAGDIARCLEHRGLDAKAILAEVNQGG
ncbi:MAG: hypothetical protein BWK76_05775 [Desulfobulbaceae bacterium A2]|nr:MAG: hypothetical protein BWK76_05775 [Desulfobulbaceae bacterium A2]